MRKNELQHRQVLQANDLGFSSLDDSALIYEVEELFSVEIPEADAEKIATIGDLIECIERLLSC